MPDDHRNDGTMQTRGRSGAARPDDEGMSADERAESGIKMLEAAAQSPDPGMCQKAVGQLLSQGIRPEEVADFYIPEAARRMGEAWCKDEIGFANVTIGASRLQSMLRELSQIWARDSEAKADAPTVLLIVAHDIHHTLGAMVVSGQLRRKGVSVRLMLNARPHDAAAAARRGNYDAIFLSASCGEKLESLRKIVDSIRQDQDQPTPIVIGGTVLSEKTNVLKKTGADYTTNDPDEALDLCGLNNTSRQRLTHEQVS